MRVLAISGSLRRDSNNTALLRALREEAPAGVEVEVWDGLKEIPPYDGDDDVVPGPAPGRGVPLARARGRRGLLRNTGVQLVHPGRAQERARLGLPPTRHERLPQQAGRRDRLERGGVRRRVGSRRAAQGARRDGRARHRGRDGRRPCARQARRRPASSPTTRFATVSARRSSRSSRRPRPAFVAA